jgi:hypothetical protein
VGATVLESFTVNFGLDPSLFKKGESEVSDATKRLRENSKKTFGEIEKRGNDMALAFKGLRNEIVGLGLAFMGANSITGMISNMMQGAMGADRLGRAIGTAAGSVYAWRKAVKETGGQPGDADAALQGIANAQSGYIKGRPLPGDPRAWSRLGITPGDMQGGKDGLNPSQILEKIAQARGKFSAKNFDGLLQDIGLPTSIRYLLEDPSKNIKDLIKQFEKDTAGQAKMAKDAEDLQKALTELNDTVTKKLTPAVIKIAEILNKAFGAHTVGGVVGAISDGVGSGLQSVLPGDAIVRAIKGKADPKERRIIDEATERFFRSMGVDPQAAHGIAAGVHAEGGSLGFASGTKDKKGRMAFGIGQWRGERQRALFKRFGTHAPNLAQQLQFLWEEMNDGHHAGEPVLRSHNAYDAMIKYIGGVMGPGAGYAGDVYRGTSYLRSHPAGGDTHNYHIKSTDPKAVAHEIHQIQNRKRRHAVAQADRGVHS